MLLLGKARGREGGGGAVLTVPCFFVFGACTAQVVGIKPHFILMYSL